MASYRVLRGVVVNGGPRKVGDVVELAETDARLLLGSGKVELVTETTNRAVGVEGSPTKPTTRAKAKPKAKAKRGA